MRSFEIDPLIYVVEGNSGIGEIIKDALGYEDLYPKIVETVEEIYSILGQLTPALVIVELQRERISAERNLFEDLKKKNVLSLALDWALSPNPNPEEIEERRELLGVTAVIPKPFKIDSLVGAVKSLTNSLDSQKDKQQLPVPPRPEPE